MGIDADSFRHIQQIVTEKRTRRTTPNNGYLRIIAKHQLIRRLPLL
jgi:hypothetical protein